MPEPDCAGFAAACARCACEVRLEEELDDRDEAFCVVCAAEIDREYAQDELESARDEIRELRDQLAAAIEKMAD